MSAFEGIADKLAEAAHVSGVPGTDIRIAMTAMIGADFGPRLLQIASCLLGTGAAAHRERR
jgi:hypothetical protein